jgi:hypothetical protein
MLQNKLETLSKQQVTKVTLDWRDSRNDNEAWNEICAWTIEHFGLPNTIHVAILNENEMRFYFYNEHRRRSLYVEVVMTLEDEIVNNVAREIAEELDWEIISDLLKVNGLVSLD